MCHDMYLGLRVITRNKIIHLVSFSLNILTHIYSFSHNPYYHCALLIIWLIIPMNIDALNLPTDLLIS